MVAEHSDGAACCPHYPPKTSLPTSCHHFASAACCPHYPPKTKKQRKSGATISRLLSTLSPKNPPARKTLLNATSACCPHYPPKTKLQREQRCDLTMPAVHTIPQKLNRFGVLLLYDASLLSTLSPKNNAAIRWWDAEMRACCPHYPPKTQVGSK